MKKILLLCFLFGCFFQANSQCPLSCLPEGAIYEITPLYFDSINAKFNSIKAKIPELADLGVKTIYLMPVFKASQVGPTASDPKRFGNQYNIDDYYQFDSHYGTAADMKNLIDTAHAHGIRVLFDLVLNHTYYPSVAMDSSWDYQVSPTTLADSAAAWGYPIMYDTIGAQIFPYVNKQYINSGTDSTYTFRGWLNNGVIHVMHYPTWKWWFGLDYTNPGLIRYVVNLSKYFITQYDFDGWRIDAPSNNWNPYLFSGNHSMVTLLQTVKDSMIAIKPSCVMIAEDPSSGRQQNAPNDFDQMTEASYNDNFIACTWATTGVINAPPYEVPDLLVRLDSSNILYSRSRIYFSENHDNPRIATSAPDLNIPLLVFNSTIYPGIPMIHAGQEIGATTKLHSIPVSYSPSQLTMWNLYRKILTTRNAYNSLKYGTLSDVLTSTTAVDTPKTYSYVRDYNGEQILVMVNFNSYPVTNTMNLPFSPTTILYDSLSTDSFTITNPLSFQINMLPYSARILIPNTLASIKPVSDFSTSVKFYPNPFNETAALEIANWKNQNCELRIYDLFGREVRKIEITNAKTEIPRDNLPSGFYFYQVEDKQQVIGNGKIIIQ